MLGEVVPVEQSRVAQTRDRTWRIKDATTDVVIKFSSAIRMNKSQAS